MHWGNSWSVGIQGPILVPLMEEVSQEFHILYRSWNGIGLPFSTPADPFLAQGVVWLWRFLSPRRQEKVCSLPWMFLISVVLPEIGHTARSGTTWGHCSATITSSWWGSILRGYDTSSPRSLGYRAVMATLALLARHPLLAPPLSPRPSPSDSMGS